MPSFRTRSLLVVLEVVAFLHFELSYDPALETCSGLCRRSAQYTHYRTCQRGTLYPLVHTAPSLYTVSNLRSAVRSDRWGLVALARVEGFHQSRSLDRLRHCNAVLDCTVEKHPLEVVVGKTWSRSLRSAAAGYMSFSTICGESLRYFNVQVVCLYATMSVSLGP